MAIQFLFIDPWNEDGSSKYGRTRGEYGNAIVGFHVHDGDGWGCVGDSDFGCQRTFTPEEVTRLIGDGLVVKE